MTVILGFSNRDLSLVCSIIYYESADCVFKLHQLNDSRITQIECEQLMQERIDLFCAFLFQPKDAFAQYLPNGADLRISSNYRPFGSHPVGTQKRFYIDLQQFLISGSFRWNTLSLLNHVNNRYKLHDGHVS